MNFEAAKDHILQRLGKELPEHLSYHGFHHTLEVLGNAKEYAKYYEVNGDDLKLLLTAALFHDSGFMHTYTNHEEESCTIAQESLSAFGYSAEEIDRISAMIMATKIPQEPNGLLQEIICDSDLDYLGRDDFFTIGNELFLEFFHLGIVESEESWNKLQVNFLKSHSFHTEYAKKNRMEKKSQHLEHLEKLVASYNN